MIIRKTLNIILSLSLTLQALVFHIALPNLVLCFGDDGHIAFELKGEMNQCAHDNTVSNIIPFLSENEIAKTPGVDCTDIDLHSHPSFADKIPKKNHTFYTTSTFEQSNFWKMRENPFTTSVGLTHTIPHNPIIGTLQSTVLII